MNSDADSLISEFLVHEFINIWIHVSIHMDRLWIDIHKFIDMNSWYEFILQIKKNSVFWIRDIILQIDDAVDCAGSLDPPAWNAT